MTTGKIKFFNAAKKFGFVTADGGKDLFLPSSSISAGDLPKLKAGTRVSFDSVADPKGSKAVNLKLLAETQPAAAENPTIYFDPAVMESEVVIEAVRARDLEPILIDYTATPLAMDQLKRLAILLSAVDQNLVRRYHPMFLELRLDDRFIAETEYWAAVGEHPVLINGPVVVAGSRASICLSQAQVIAFFDQDLRVEAKQKPKQISARLAAMMAGQTVPAPEMKPTPALQDMPVAGSHARPPKPVTKPAKARAKAPRKKAARSTKTSMPARKASRKPAHRSAKKPAGKIAKRPVRSAKKPSAKKKKQ